EAQAVQGALTLDTLVVAPAGNDGAAGPLYGSIAGPAGSRAAVTVGATDERPTTTSRHTGMRIGLDGLLHEPLPLLATGTHTGPFEAAVALPRGDGPSPLDFFDARGLSLVAGRAVLVHAGVDPGGAALAAAQAGARAVLVYGKSLPSGSLGISSELGVPVVAVPNAAVAKLLRARAEGYGVAV